jgi:hypothetical protein
MIGVDTLDVAGFQTWSNELIDWYTKQRGLGESRNLQKSIDNGL